MPRGRGRRHCKLGRVPGRRLADRGTGQIFGGTFLRVMMGWSACRMICAAVVLVLGLSGLAVQAQTPVAVPAPTAAPPSAQSQLGNTSGIVREVRIEGTQRIEPETVRSYLLVQPGDPFNDERIDRSLKALFATGL